ncbi:MAG: hypothetical protein ACOH1E_03505 [Brevundimonas sp.]
MALTMVCSLATSTPAFSQAVDDQSVAPGQQWEACGVSSPLMPPPPELVACLAASGPVADQTFVFQLGDEIPAELERQSPVGDGLIFHTAYPVSLEWMTEAGPFLFENVGGMGQTVLLMSLDSNTRRLDRVAFAWQNRPLLLHEAVERARRLETWLLAAGFVQTPPRHPADAPFALIDDHRGTPSRAETWVEAEALLKQEHQALEMTLLNMGRPGTEIYVSVSNARRQTWAFGANRAHLLPPGTPRSIYDGNGGYEWQLEVSISASE